MHWDRWAARETRHGREAATFGPPTREEYSLNNNNRNNNRRRGRGNRNQSGGGNNANRIDSRARGNAPQLLDKYKKLAQDAQHNGDRVQAEYYLQFADHYFRVIADNKARQDEQRGKRDSDRGSERGQANDDSSDDDEDQNESQNRGQNRGDDDRRKAKPKRSNRNEKQRGRDRETSDADDSSDDDDGDEVFESDENPFVRKRDAQPRRASARGRKKDSDDSDDSEIDAAVLPPAIAAATGGGGDKPAKAKPARRSRKTAEGDPRDDGDDEALSAVG